MENEIEQKILAQKKFCEEKQLPHFAPEDGRCYRCGKQIYIKIDLKRAANELITGCPHCMRSYCD